LTQQLNPVSLEIIDDSHKHAGHAAMKGLNKKETHFRVNIVSDSFSGKPLIQRHRLVYDILAQEIQDGVHALQLSTKTPDQV
ncbi:bola protein, partial [Paraphysoderma sedebokerense]